MVRTRLKLLIAALLAMASGYACQSASIPTAPPAQVPQPGGPSDGAGTAADSLPAYNGEMPQYPFRDPRLSAEVRARDLVSRLTLQEKIAQMMHDTPAVERLGVPAYSWWNEALHGVARQGRATVFPQAIGLAATFDPGLVHEVASAIAIEARAKFNAAVKLGNRGRYAGLTFWSPNINIFRDPRWGRGQETYGEDPYLTSRMGVAFVKGLQGDDPKHLRTAACAKHFAVHSGPEALRHEFNVRPSKKDLYETYLPAFEALVTEGKVECVMSAYNRVNGEPASASPELLRGLLRKAWGFDGYVVSDCWALEDIHRHHQVTQSASESAASALLAGVNLDCGNTFAKLGQSLTEGLTTEAQIDQALAQLLETRFRLGLFDASTPYDALGPELVGSEANAALARRAATASIVLLKNAKGTLPLNKRIKRLSLLGPYAADGYVLLGNYFGHSARLTTLVEGITAKIDAGTSLEFRSAFLPDRPNPNPIDWTTGAARGSNAVIVTLGLSGLLEGEEGAAIASPFKGDRQDLKLPENQVTYLRKLRAAGDAQIISVVFGGSAIDLAEVAVLSDALLFAWYPGQEGGSALADIIFGDAAPSGRLPLTFPRSVDDLPAFTDYSMSKRGYRYAEQEPMFPFGFGLSYSEIRYESLQLSASTLAANEVTGGEKLTATVALRNHGARVVKEVAQAYLSDLDASVRVPRAKLVGFQRVALAPGARTTLSFDIDARALELIDEAGKRRLEPGRFRLSVGGAAPSQRGQALGTPAPVHAEFSLR